MSQLRLCAVEVSVPAFRQIVSKLSELHHTISVTDFAVLLRRSSQTIMRCGPTCDCLPVYTLTVPCHAGWQLLATG